MAKSPFFFDEDMALKADAFEAISFQSVNIEFIPAGGGNARSAAGRPRRPHPNPAESGYAINSDFVQERMLE